MADKKRSTGLWALGAKMGTKVLTVLPKILKATKFLKFGLAAVSFAGYAAMYTWKFAVLIMVALAWHESGHVYAMRQMGIKTKGFYFIPFLGGAAVAEENYRTYGENSYIAMMGPIWGLGLTVACCIVYYATGITLFAGAAAWMAFINLFNLAPIVPLDGGQVIRSIAFSIHKSLGFGVLFFSLIASTIIMFKFHIGLFAFLLIIGILELGVEYFRRRSFGKRTEYYLEQAETSHDKYAALAAKGKDDELKKYYTEMADDRKKYYTDRSKEVALKKVPNSMNKVQLLQSIAAFAITAVALIAIVKIMGQVPGADLASSFLADK